MATVIGASGAGYPVELAQYAGRILDLDGHEWSPPHLWPELFGEETRAFAAAEAINIEGCKEYLFPNNDSYIEETEVVDSFTVWNAKGPFARAAYDMDKRLEVMDFTGVAKQVIFPGNLVIAALNLMGFADNPYFFPSITGDRRAYAKRMVRLHNDWVVRQQRRSERLRPVATLMGDTVDDLYAEAKRLIDAGVRVLWLPSATLPGGKSPAHSDLDRFWALCASSNTVCTLHIGNEPDFFKSHEWNNAPFFQATEWNLSSEYRFDPWTLSTFALPSWNFMAAVIGGGVFDRHPELRFGIQELGGFWVGAMGEGMDQWGEFTPTKPWKTKLKMRPSDYIRRNIKVTPYCWEPIDLYIERYGFEDVFCYASDFPHVEGGKSPMQDEYDRIHRLGDEQVRKFFTDNGKWLVG